MAYKHTVENAVYVDTRYQSKGVGTAILKALVEIAQRKGYRTIIAQVVAENEPSLKLHVKFGFEEVGRLRQVGRKFDRWLDVVILQKMMCDAPES